MPVDALQQGHPGQNQSQAAYSHAGTAAGVSHGAAHQATDVLESVAASPETEGAEPLAGDTLTRSWQSFFDHIGTEGFDELDHKTQVLQRQIRDNGITYNVYAEQAQAGARPWQLELFPLLITPDSWQQIEAGIGQRARLLNAIVADVYGPQTLLRQGLLPAALVQGHPDYLRPLHGVRPPGNNWLHLLAFDLARGPDAVSYTHLTLPTSDLV